MASLAKDSLVAALVIQSLYQHEFRRFGIRALTAHYQAAILSANVVSGLHVCSEAVWVTFSDGIHRVYIAGVGAHRQGELVAAGYLLQPIEIDNHDINEQFLIDAAMIVARRNPSPFERQAVEVYGHSAGGATAEILGSALERSGEYFTTRIMTMGAPKASIPRYLLETPGVQRRRLMAVGDPVPLLPFSAIGRVHSITLGALVTAQLARGREPMHIWDFRHGSGGYLAASSGGIGERYDALTWNNPVDDLMKWMDEGQSQVRYHSIANYIEVITAIIAQEGPEVFPSDKGFSRLPDVTGPNLVLPLEMVGRNDNANAVRLVKPLDLIGVAPDVPQVVSIREGSVTLPGGISYPVATLRGSVMGQLKVPPALQAKPFKVSGGWQVYWMGEAIFFSMYASSARTVAKAINRLSRVYGTRGAVTAHALVAALSAFLTQAQTSPDGTRPPLVVD